MDMKVEKCGVMHMRKRGKGEKMQMERGFKGRSTSTLVVAVLLLTTPFARNREVRLLVDVLRAPSVLQSGGEYASMFEREAQPGELFLRKSVEPDL